MHELEPKVEYRALGVNLDLIESMGVGNGDIDQPPGQAWPPSTTLSWQGII